MLGYHEKRSLFRGGFYKLKNSIATKRLDNLGAMNLAQTGSTAGS
jgi:hypothetical protein